MGRVSQALRGNASDDLTAETGSFVFDALFIVHYVTDINKPSLPTPFHSVLVSVSVFMALSTLFHSINSPDNSSLSHSVLLVLILPY